MGPLRFADHIQIATGFNKWGLSNGVVAAWIMSDHILERPNPWAEVFDAAVDAVYTHLGCLVAWNDAETSWDCPCHGSRFAPTGEVLTGPAAAPLQPVEDDLSDA